MHKNQELVAYYNKTVIQNGCLSIPIVIGAALYMYYYGIHILWNFVANIFFNCFKIRWWLVNDIGYYVIFSLKSLILFFIITLLFAFIYNLFLSKSTTPLLIVNSKGIFVKRFGLIPWSNIREVAPYLGMPLDAIEIRVKNISLLFAQATISGKLSILSSKIFGYPPIIIANITLDSDEVISFAQQFIKE